MREPEVKIRYDAESGAFVSEIPVLGIIGTGSVRPITKGKGNGTGTGSPPKEDPGLPGEEEKPERKKTGGGGNGNGPLHPLIDGLIASLPKKYDDEWPIEKRVKWLRAASQNFELIYPDTGEDTIEVKIQRGTRQ